MCVWPLSNCHRLTVLIAADKIYKWLCAPDSSRNYNAAREEHRAGTSSWFVNGPQYAEWKRKAGLILWLYGAREFCDSCELWLANDTGLQRDAVKRSYGESAYI